MDRLFKRLFRKEENYPFKIDKYDKERAKTSYIIDPYYDFYLRLKNVIRYGGDPALNYIEVETKPDYFYVIFLIDLKPSPINDSGTKSLTFCTNYVISSQVQIVTDDDKLLRAAYHPDFLVSSYV